MNFGPLNNDGGERRLNVLITRAKRRCEVFSNITADDIDTAPGTTHAACTRSRDFSRTPKTGESRLPRPPNATRLALREAVPTR